MKSNFRQGDIVGRVGGDEFCVYMKDIPSSDFVYNKCQEILDLMDKIDEDFKVTLSIGVKIVRKPGKFQYLFHQADEAMYLAKRKGGNGIYLVE